MYMNSNKREEARYLRDDPAHRAIVSKYQTVARSWAKKLIENEILLNGGYIRPRLHPPDRQGKAPAFR